MEGEESGNILGHQGLWAHSKGGSDSSGGAEEKGSVGSRLAAHRRIESAGIIGKMI